MNFSKRSAISRFDKLNLDIWGSILLRFFMRVHFLLKNKGNWRKKWLKDLTSIAQSQIGSKLFWKLSLNIYVLCKWFGHKRSPVANFLYLWYLTIINVTQGWPNKFKNIYFKLMKKPKVLIIKIIPFYCSWRKKQILQKLGLVSKRGTASLYFLLNSLGNYAI